VDTNRRDEDIKQNPKILIERQLYEARHEDEEVDENKENKEC